MGFSRREYWTVLPFPSPGRGPSWPRGLSLMSPILVGNFFTTSTMGDSSQEIQPCSTPTILMYIWLYVGGGVCACVVYSYMWMYEYYSVFSREAESKERDVGWRERKKGGGVRLILRKLSHMIAVADKSALPFFWLLLHMRRQVSHLWWKPWDRKGGRSCRT